MQKNKLCQLNNITYCLNFKKCEPLLLQSKALTVQFVYSIIIIEEHKRNTIEKYKSNLLKWCCTYKL